MRGPQPPRDDGPRINQFIDSREVLLIDASGEKRGVVPTRDAIAIAEEAGLDLVEVSPNTSPPVCKILDYGKYKYQAQKKAAEARKNQKIIEIKEIKMRPNIDTHDYDVKMRSIRRFFEEGDKVKVTLRFRGREMAHTELGIDLLNRVKSDTLEIAKVEVGAEARRPPDGDGAVAALNPAAFAAMVAIGSAGPYKAARVSNRPASLEGMPWRFLMLRKDSKMPKMKTKSSCKKRFNLTASGKMRATQAGKRHGMIKRTNKQIRNSAAPRSSSRAMPAWSRSIMPYR